MKPLSVLVAIVSIANLALAAKTPDLWTYILGGVGLACAAATWGCHRISTFLKILAATFATEVVVFGGLSAVAKAGLLPDAVRAYLPSSTFSIGVGFFTVLVFAVSHIPVIRQMMRIADPFFESRARTTARLWPLPPFATSDRGIAIGMLVFVVLLNQVEVGFSVRLNYFNRDFVNALNEKNQADFWKQLLLVFVPWASALITALSVEYAVKSNLLVRWRRFLTDVYLQRWLNGPVHYRMSLAGSTDNPDQRIAEDVNRFLEVGSGETWGIYTFTIQLIANLSSVVAFSIILWTLSTSFTLPGTSIIIPGFLFWVAILYTVVGTLGAHVIGRTLVPLFFDRQKYEANFRFSLARVREYSEQVALLKGEPIERRTLMGRFGDIVRNYLRIVGRTKWLIAFQQFFNQISSVIPYVLAAPFYFLGKITFGVLTQTAHAFGSVQNGLNFFVDYYSRLADFRSVLARLTSFDDAMNRAEGMARPAALTTTYTALAEPLSAHDLQLSLPDGRRILSDGNFTLQPSEPALFTGPSGSGKSTLFRAVAGIWPFATGQLKVPAEGRSMLLPQRPYIPIGSLRTALTYPAAADDYAEAAIHEALAAVGLVGFDARLDAEENWSQALSGGEQQRVAVARALLAKPDWLFLDEATSALDEIAEAQVYRAIFEHLPQTTIVSIGHRSALTQFHKQRIEMQPASNGTATPVVTPLAAAAE